MAGPNWLLAKIFLGELSTSSPSSNKCSIGIIYKYVQGEGYQQINESEMLEPGRGYWILLNNVMDQAELRVETTQVSP